MKKTIMMLAAVNLFWVGACSTKKQPGEEYYDPNYKPQPTQPVTQSPTPAPDAAAVETPETAVNPAADTPAAAEPKTGETAKAGDAKVAVAPKEKPKPAPAGLYFTKGKNLIAKSDCLACHKNDVKLLGPAYMDVAKKYEPTDANITLLANKIIKGGAGVWGEIPMSPHASLPQSDAKEMVKYILSLK